MLAPAAAKTQIMDWVRRAVLAWRLSNTLGADFCVEALEEALSRYGRPEIFNTDQGSQFTSDRLGSIWLAPDGTGDINNYTVIYVTSNQAVAEHFQTAGLAAVFDPKLAYEYTPGPMETLGEFYLAASGQGLPAYFLFGTENEPPPNSQQSFLANWRFTGYGGKMKQPISFPVISFGTAADSDPYSLCSRELLPAEVSPS